MACGILERDWVVGIFAGWRIAIYWDGRLISGHIGRFLGKLVFYDWKWSAVVHCDGELSLIGSSILRVVMKCM